MFDNMRKRPFYKNNKFILIHALVLILLICVAYFIFNSLDTIRDIFYSIIEFLSEPKKALELFISYTIEREVASLASSKDSETIHIKDHSSV